MARTETTEIIQTSDYNTWLIRQNKNIPGDPWQGYSLLNRKERLILTCPTRAEARVAMKEYVTHFA